MSQARCHLRAALFLAAVSSRGATTGVTARRGLSARPAPQEPGMEYQDAVRTLNTLQTNAGYLEQVKRQRGDPQTQLDTMKLYLARSGLQVEDLDHGVVRSGSPGSSPHLVQVRERIRIHGRPVSPELFTKHFWHLYHRLEETKDSSSCVSMPAYFRFFTLMAFHIFLQEKVDLAVVEVGIGGAYDCTNIIRKPVVCGISSLGIDHTSLLGDTVEAIAWQKGGIFKRGVPAFTVLQPDGPLAVLRDRAQQISCPLYLCPPLEALEEGGPPLTLGLEGEHQRSNAALALQLARCWLQQKGHQGLGELKMSRPSVLRQMPLAPVFQPTSHMRHGLRDTEWLGRTQTLQRGPLTWYLDGAHTVSSVQACVRWFRQALHRSQRPNRGREVRVLLFNSTGNRDSEALLKLLQPCQFDYAVFCPNLTEVSSASNAGKATGLTSGSEQGAEAPSVDCSDGDSGAPPRQPPHPHPGLRGLSEARTLDSVPSATGQARICRLPHRDFVTAEGIVAGSDEPWDLPTVTKPVKWQVRDLTPELSPPHLF
uniref:tetrahydrofolate synthase n=1 Tax=Neovison vison TaxID=452646 RepID=A0A8C7EPA2_NEOVI